MRTFTFTEPQIVNVWLSGIDKVMTLTKNEDFLLLKEHLGNNGIRLETGIDIRIMGNDFFMDQTSQVKEQIPELIGMLSDSVEKMGFNKCSVSW